MKYLMLGILAFWACRNPENLEMETRAILDLHNKQRQAHFEKNVAMLTENDADDFIQVNRGKIASASGKEKRERFQAYFDAVEFVKWDDVTPPVISFSDDASMATTIVNKIVVLKQNDNQLDTTYFAWLAVYKKSNGKWFLHRMASTNQ